MPQPLSSAPVATMGGRSFLERALSVVRTHLEMDVAYLCEIVNGRAVFRALDAPQDEGRAGAMRRVLSDALCQQVLDGALPELIPDASAEPLVMELAFSHGIPLGAHVSIPIRLPDGTACGMFGCFSARPRRSLGEQQLQIMRIFAYLAASEVTGAMAERQLREECEARVAEALGGAFRVVYQPMFDLREPLPMGFEALCRFTPEPYRSPDLWFADAAELGRQVELEMLVIEKALEALDHLPGTVHVSINASPRTVVEGDLIGAFGRYPIERIVLELTEHAIVEDYPTLGRALAPLRCRGVRLAIDDAGAGYAGLQHIVRLRPDILKLDMTLTRDIDTDKARRAMAAALVHFAAETGAEIVAEGIETAAEVEALYALGIDRGQGYFLGRPEPLMSAEDWFAPGGQTAMSA